MKIIISKSYKENRKPPENFQKKDSKIFKHEFNRIIPKNYYFFSSKVLIFNEIIVNLKKFRIYKKYTFFGDKTFVQEIKRVVKNFTSSRGEVEHLQAGMWVTDHKSTTYFHWILDSLQRAISVKDNNSKYPILLSNRFHNLKYVVDFLETFSLKYIVLKEDVIYKVNRLLITSKTAPSGNYHKETIQLLKNEIANLRSSLSQDKAKSYENLFIVRKNNLHRSGIGLELLQPILDKFNFKVIDFEELSVLEKINNLQYTKNLIGVFGSGLTNMIFMNKNSNVLEIRLENDSHNNAFYSLANICGINYYYLFYKSKNMEFDLAQFEVILEKMTN
tara:strand:+ start:39059 stop:40054 length:996 start_codon:yes stop_codon:yes gene_type:complete